MWNGDDTRVAKEASHASTRCTRSFHCTCDEFSLQRNGNTVGGFDLGEKTTDRHKEAVASLVKEPRSVLQKKRSLAFDINCIIVACEFSCTQFW
jgi:hypothetical protein